jgi:hypothetical protein
VLLRRLLVSVLSVAALVSFGGTGVGSLGCGRAVEPANRTVDRCVATCAKRASRQCSEDECRRGCEFILDRILEKEGDNVVACVSRAPRRCTDVVWADCAARIGVHADGGPPAPPPPSDED